MKKLKLALCITAFCFTSATIAQQTSPAAAQATAGSYPNKPVTMIVAFPPGGGTDIVARRVAQGLTAAWGQSVIVENKGGSCCNASEQHDYAMLATNRRIMLYNIDKQKPDCCCTLFCCCTSKGKTQAVHTITIADAQYIEGAQLFYSGMQFDLCCCGVCCQRPYWGPFFGMPRGEIFIDGVNFHQEFISMGMDTPVTNRMFQVISALSQAARVDKVSAENFVEQGLVQHYAKAASFASAAVAYQSAASNFPPPSVPHSMVEVVVSNGV